MHEHSLVRSLLTQVEQLRVEHGAAAVTRVAVEIGPLSGVEPLLVREAFDRLVGAGSSPELALDVHDVPLVCRCRDCETEWSATTIRFVCPTCRSTAVQVVSGDEFRIRSITVLNGQPAEVTP